LWLSDAMLVMEVFPCSADFLDPEANISQFIGFLCEIGLQCCQNRVGLKPLLGEKFDDDSLRQFHPKE
jgi:hypothetical protein